MTTGAEVNSELVGAVSTVEMAEALRASGWWIRCWLRLMAVRSR